MTEMQVTLASPQLPAAMLQQGRTFSGSGLPTCSLSACVRLLVLWPAAKCCQRRVLLPCHRHKTIILEVTAKPALLCGYTRCWGHTWDLCTYNLLDECCLRTNDCSAGWTSTSSCTTSLESNTTCVCA